MEQLIFLLFVLFSIFSALRERNKQKKQIEEHRRRSAQRRRREAELAERPFSPPRPAEKEEVGIPSEEGLFEIESTSTAPPIGDTQATEREEIWAVEQEALAAEQRALEVQQAAVEWAQRSREQLSQQSDRMREQRIQEESRAAGGRWRLDPVRAREAIVYAEILGPPKAERQENF